MQYEKYLEMQYEFMQWQYEDFMKYTIKSTADINAPTDRSPQFFPLINILVYCFYLLPKK